MTASLPFVSPGRPWPLGASLAGDGVNFAVASGAAERIELCLFDADGPRDRGGWRWPGAAARSSTASCRACGRARSMACAPTGPGTRHAGQRFDPAKLLLDPYAKAVAGRFAWTEAHGRRQCRSRAARDTAARHAQGRGRGRPGPLAGAGPDTPWAETLLYEAHVKGLTARHPGVPEALRGHYLGLAQPAVLDHLVKLGVTAVELMPVCGVPRRAPARRGSAWSTTGATTR